MLAAVAAYALHAALPSTALDLPLADRFDVRTVIPQGWAFFTRDPREAAVVPYLRGPSGEWSRASLNPRSDYALGLDRQARVQGVEMALLVQGVRRTWTRCEDEPAACLRRSAPGVRITNPSPSPSLCGDVALVSQEPLPWAWARSGASEPMESTFVRLEVSCSPG